MSQYPYEAYLSVTSKWWVKFIIILLTVCVFMIIWAVQPRFGRSLMGLTYTGKSNDNVYRFSDNMGNSIFVSDNNGNIEVTAKYYGFSSDEIKPTLVSAAISKTNPIFPLIMFSILSTIGHLFIFYAKRFNPFGIYGRPILSNSVSAVVVFAFAIPIAFKLL